MLLSVMLAVLLSSYWRELLALAINEISILWFYVELAPLSVLRSSN